MSADSSAFGSESAGAIDAEHQIQIGLVRALCDAVRSGADARQTRQILEQLVDYSEAHFMSEQLLMRLSSYPDYDDHVLDHDQMMQMLRTVAASNGEDQDALALDQTQNMLSFLSRHIASRDRRFTEHYLEWSRRVADGATSAPDAAP